MYQKNDSVKTILQIDNVTKHILFTEEKSKNKLASMINATVSHELRNPLNSVIAKNVEKEKLYEHLSS